MPSAPAAVLACLLVAACGPRSAAQAEELVAAWDEDPQGTVARVLALEDPAQRLLAVERLSEAYPGQTRLLCQQLPAGAARERCQSLNQRPHLSRGPPAEVRAGATGPSGGALQLAIPDHGWDARWPADEARPCQDRPDRGACLDEAARSAVGERRWAHAWRICGLHDEARYQQECRFRAAEGSLEGAPARIYRGAACLCAEAGDFAPMCHAHLLMGLHRRCFAAEAPDPAALEASLGIAAAIRATWAAHPDIAQRFEDQFWALHLHHAFYEAPHVTGDLLDHLPEAAWPHVRAAAATRLQALGQSRGLLQQRADLLRVALARRATDPEPRLIKPVPRRSLERWNPPEPPPQGGRLVSYLGQGRRLLGSSEDSELAICVLEAGARSEPVQRGLLLQGKQSALPEVAWTAARNLAAVKNGDYRSQAPGPDPAGDNGGSGGGGPGQRRKPPPMEP